MTAEPPVVAGAAQETVTCALPEAPTTPEGALGAPSGVMVAVAADAWPLPMALTASTSNWYPVPSVSPVTVQVVAVQVVGEVEVAGEKLVYGLVASSTV